jgi:hypothetical protein
MIARALGLLPALAATAKEKLGTEPPKGRRAAETSDSVPPVLAARRDEPAFANGFAQQSA